MTSLSDTQRILLSTASQRESGSLLPLPTCLKASSGTAKAINALIKSGLVEERPTSAGDEARRTDDDQRVGAYITAAGLTAIDASDRQYPAHTSISAEIATTIVRPAPRVSKTATVLALLERDGGATLPELIEATDWLPHTTRAALTGMRKKGHAIERTKRDGVTCYRIVQAPAA